MLNRIHIYPNFLSEEEHRTLLQFSIDNPQVYGETREDDFWAGRTYEPIQLGNEVQTISKRYVNKVRELISQVHGAKVYCDLLCYSKWWDGYEQQPHADGEREGGVHEFYWRKYGCVYYLNDDFEGGEIYFPNFNIEKKVEPNTMIFFPGDLLHLHGVRNVSKGVRHTMASFWTDDKSKEHEFYRT